MDTAEKSTELEHDLSMVTDNYTLAEKCLISDFENFWNTYAERENEKVKFCNTTFDGVLCWPTSPANKNITLTCPDEYDGQGIIPGGVAVKFCQPNGVWYNWTNYKGCHFTGGDQTSLSMKIYMTGYSISTIALVIALVIFTCFRALRCLRNVIHCHLIVTFILRNLMWMVLFIMLPRIHLKNDVAYEWLCKLSVTIFQYLHVTNFFWMLVEGIYLLFMVVWAFSYNKVKIWYFIIIGWCVRFDWYQAQNFNELVGLSVQSFVGLPVLVIITWAAVKYVFDNDKCWGMYNSSHYSYIHIVPVLLVLLINTIILIVIVYILVTKLRATNCAHTRQSNSHFRKAIKATLVLFPLLGLTYILFITTFSRSEVEQKIYTYFNAVFQSIQGLEVAVFYCFLNGEVKSVIKGKVSQWQDERSVATRYTRTSVVSAMDHSPSVIKHVPENGGTTRGMNKPLTPVINDKEIPLTSAEDGHYGDEML